MEHSTEGNTLMLVGYVLICLSLIVLIFFCCCFGKCSFGKSGIVDLDRKRSNVDEEKGLEIIDTDSSGSESSKDVSCLIIFMKGRQAGMNEGIGGETLDAYAIGFVDGSHFATERKVALTDAKVLTQGKRLGYAGASANAYLQGFQNGVRIGISPNPPYQRHSYESGLLNAEVRGLHEMDREAYAKGFAAGDAADAAFESESALMDTAESYGFSRASAELFAAGYHDGFEGRNITDVLSPSAAFQKGVSKAAARNLSENHAHAHAFGFRDGYASAIETEEEISELALVAKASDIGFKEDVGKCFCHGYKEGFTEGKIMGKSLVSKGMKRSEKYGMTNDFQSAFALGYKNGIVNTSLGKAYPGDQILKETSKNLRFSDDTTTAYVRGFKDGMDTIRKVSANRMLLALPEAVFESEYLKSREEDSDEEAAVARASGMRDGYRHGLDDKRMETKQAITAMAGELGFRDHDVDIYQSKFLSGVLDGHVARDIALLKGRHEACGLGLSGSAGKTYANGYRDGFSKIMSGFTENDLLESTFKEKAKQLGVSSTLVTSYINGFQDGKRRARVIVSRGYTYSTESYYAKGLIEFKLRGLTGEACHASASGYSDGYTRGINGDFKYSRAHVRRIAVEIGFDDDPTQNAFDDGFSQGFDDGVNRRISTSKFVLSPDDALEAGIANAGSCGLKEKAAEVYACAFGDGYAVGLAGHQCRSDSQLTQNALHLGISSDFELAYVSGFKGGWQQGEDVKPNWNVLYVSSEDTLMKGVAKADAHGMKGATADAFGQGYHDGFAEAMKRLEEKCAEPDLSREELANIARDQGFVTTAPMYAYVAGHIIAQADGGVVVLYHSLCDVHRCHSTSCLCCVHAKEPKFVHVPRLHVPV